MVAIEGCVHGQIDPRSAGEFGEDRLAITRDDRLDDTDAGHDITPLLDARSGMLQPLVDLVELVGILGRWWSGLELA